MLSPRTESPIDPANALEAAYERRYSARDRQQQARRSTERGRQVLANAAKNLDGFIHEDEVTRQRQAEHLQRWISLGNAGEPPTLMQVPERVQERATAELRAQAATTAVTTFQAAEMEAERELAAAEQAVQRAVDALLLSEAETMADEVCRLAEEILAFDRQLRAIVPLVGINTPVSKLQELRLFSPALERAQRMGKLLHQDREIHTPSDVLRGERDDATQERDALTIRRAALIAGDTE